MPTKRTAKGTFDNVLIIKESPTEVIIIIDYGDKTAGIATTYCSDGYLTTEYYQDRIYKDFKVENMSDIYTQLSYGKMYSKDWNDKKKVDNAVIKDALKWLYFSALRYFKFRKTIVKSTSQKETFKAVENFLWQ